MIRIRGFGIRRRISRLTARLRYPLGRTPYFVFIIASARSGSTLLQKIIGSNSGCRILGENNDVLGALITAYQRAREAKATEGNEPRDSIGDPWFGIHQTDPERFGRRLARLFVREFLRPRADSRILGFKEIRYMDNVATLESQLEHMRALFTPLLFVFNRRNNLDTAKSLSSWWPDIPVHQIEANIALFNTRITEYAKAHPDHSILIDYDEYMKDCNHLRPLFARLKLPFNQKRIEDVLSVKLRH